MCQTGKEIWKFLKLLKNVSIELPFLDAMSDIPAFLKFLNTLCSNEHKLDEIVQVSKEVSVKAFMIGNLPPKLADIGSFGIPVTVGNVSVDQALCDLGASVSLMPYSMYKRLRNVNELTPTRMTLQLADCSIVYPKGILSDVALKIGKLVVPCDFIIMDIPKDVKTLSY
jgi:hypothetical protein